MNPDQHVDALCKTIEQTLFTHQIRPAEFAKYAGVSRDIILKLLRRVKNPGTPIRLSYGLGMSLRDALIRVEGGAEVPRIKMGRPPKKDVT